MSEHTNISSWYGHQATVLDTSEVIHRCTLYIMINSNNDALFATATSGLRCLLYVGVSDENFNCQHHLNIHGEQMGCAMNQWLVFNSTPRHHEDLDSTEVSSEGLSSQRLAYVTNQKHNKQGKRRWWSCIVVARWSQSMKSTYIGPG